MKTADEIVAAMTDEEREGFNELIEPDGRHPRAARLRDDAIALGYRVAMREVLSEMRDLIVHGHGFDEAWAREHAKDDHMVTLDHKDEMDLAEMVLDLLRVPPGV